MPFPILLTASLFLHCKPQVTRVSAQKSDRPAVTAVKDDIQFVMIDPRSKLSHRGPYRQMMPLKAVLKLDEQAVETGEEQALVAAINRERVLLGMSTLVLDPLLTETARIHCREMCKLDYFEHQSPTPSLRSPMDRYLSSLQKWGEGEPRSALIGENIFYCSTTNTSYDAAFAHSSLMASPGHRANILNPRFGKVGVGLYRDPQGQFWVTEMFLRDSGS